MLQHGLRSVVYRSFAMCEDPKGVAECATIRKTKSGSNKMEGKIKDRMIEENSSSSSTSFKEERMENVREGSTKELQNRSSIQIVEVSRGAEKLNEVIDLWSNRTRLDKQPKYIAEDLLKGALDLQESLMMLGKLQEASESMAKSKKRHNGRVGGWEIVEGTELIGSDLSGDSDRAIDFQKSRISANQPSRDCYDELREVIRESFAKQNLLPKVSHKHNDFLDRKSMDFCMDFPSTSSGQSSLIHSHSSDCSPNIHYDKPKGPNLIAKLMGLEEVPPKAIGCQVYKQMEQEKHLSRRCSLDINLPGPRKPQFMVQERRRQEKTIEAMHFKGILERHNYEPNGVPFMRNSSTPDDPLIVIMKPLNVLGHRTENFHANHGVNEEKFVKSRQMPRRRTGESQPAASNVRKAETKSPDTNEKFPAGRTAKRNSKGKEGNQSGESPARLIKKTQDIHNNPTSMKINHCKSMIPEVRKKEEIANKSSDTRKQTQTKDAEYRESAKFRDAGKVTTSKLSKTVKSNVSKVQVAQEKTTTAARHMKTASIKSSFQKKNLQNGKAVSKPSTALVKEKRCNDNSLTGNESHIQDSTKSATSERIAKEMIGASCDPITGDSGDGSCSCESTETTIEDGVKIFEDDTCIPCTVSGDIKGQDSSIITTKCLLLNNVAFCNRARELFDTRPEDPSVSRTAWIDHEILDTSILLECADEILDRKILRWVTAVNPLSQNLCNNPKCCSTLQQLVGEISLVIEDLRDYSKCCDDGVYSMLERDLDWKGEIATSCWDIGWRNRYTMEEIKQVVNDVEKLVLNEAVHDMVIDFSFK